MHDQEMALQALGQSGMREIAQPTMRTRHRAWIRLPSGCRLDLMNPAPGDWQDADLASRLSRTYRWGGESSWSRPLSVAQHSLTVLALRRQWSDGTLNATQALMELLHDAEEGFLGFDCISPLKAALGQPFQDVSNRLLAAIWSRYGLPSWSTNEQMMHKRADLVAAATEAVHYAGWSRKEVRDVLGITHAVLDVDPLAVIYGCNPWEPWESRLAEERFLRELEFLKNLAQKAFQQSA